MKINLLILSTILLIQSSISIALSLPPPEDIPEEILRNEIITEGISIINGEALTASEYAQLEAELAQGKYPPEIAAKIRHLIFLLEIRQMINLINPF
jgi:hypothetical protein